MSTIAEMVVRLGGDNRDLAAVFASSETRAQAFQDKLSQIEASAQTNAAMLAAEREAKAAASAARTQRSIEQAFHTGSGAVAAEAAAAPAMAHAREELGALATMHEQVAHHAGNHTLAIGRLEMSLERFSAEALGVNHTLGLVGAGFARFALGSLETAGVLAGLALIVAVWEHVTGAAREAQKEQEAAIKSFEKAQEAAQMGPQGETLNAINERIDAINRETTARQKLIDAARGQNQGPASQLLTSGQVGTEIGAALAQRHLAEQQATLDRLNEDLSRALDERNRIIDAKAQETDAAFTRSLETLVKFDAHDKDIRAQALTRLSEYQVALKNTAAADIETRALLAGKITGLRDVLFPKSEANDAAREQQARIAGLVTEMNNLRERGEAYSGVMTQLLDTYGQLGTGIKRADETWQQFQTRSQQIHTIVRAISDTVANIHIPDIKPPVLPEPSPYDYQSWLQNYGQQKPGEQQPSPQMRQLNDMIAAMQLAQKNLDITNLTRGTQGQAPVDNTSVILEHQRAIAQQVEVMRREYMATGLPVQVINELMQQLLDKLKAAGIDTGTLKDNFVEVQKAIDAISAAGNLAQALGASDLATFLGNAAAAAGAIADAAAQGFTNPASDISAVASVVTLVRGMFDSPLHREQLQLMRENNQRLTQMTLALQGFQTNASNTTGAGQAAGAALAQPGVGGAIGALELFGTLQQQIDLLTPYLKAVGLSWVQFAQIAKDSGINIFDSHGRIVIGALEQFAAAAHDAVKALFTFSSSFSDQLSLINIQQQLQGPQTQAQQMQAQLEAIMRTAPGLLPGGLDSGTVAGRNAIRDALQQLVAGISAGTIDPSKFGGFQNLQELLGAINPLIQALNDLTGATIATTTGLVNVPPTFRYALTAFENTVGDPLNPGRPSSATPLTPTMPHPVAGAGDFSLTIHVDSMSFGAGGAAIGSAELEGQVDDMLGVLRQRAVETFGDPTRWSEVQPLT